MKTMTPEDFVNSIRQRVLYENCQIYSDLLRKTNPSKATDPIWQKIITVYQKATADEKKLIEGFVRQIITDTLSSILAVLDSSTWLDGQREDLKVSHENTILNGDLQDLFLQQMEDEQ